MTEVELLRTFQISPDGLRIETWPKGSIRHVDDATLAILIGEGLCAIVDRKAPPENKAHGAAPENKTRKRGRPRKAKA